MTNAHRMEGLSRVTWTPVRQPLYPTLYPFSPRPRRVRAQAYDIRDGGLAPPLRSSGGAIAKISPSWVLNWPGWVLTIGLPSSMAQRSSSVQN